MDMPFLQQLGAWIAGAAAFLGPWGVFLIALADSALVPMPQGVDTLLIAQAIATPETAYLGAALGTAGSLLGSLVLYGVARGAGKSVLERRLSEHGVRKLRRTMGQWGAAALVPVTMIPLPLPMKPVVLAAGAFQMPVPSFCAAIAGARVVRYFGQVLLARRYGSDVVLLAAQHAHLALATFVALGAGLIAVHFLSNRWLNR